MRDAEATAGATNTPSTTGSQRAAAAAGGGWRGGLLDQGHQTPHANDPALLPFLRASDMHAAQRCLEDLLHSQARPIVREIVQRKVRRRAGWGDAIEAAADVEGDVIAQLLARLRDLRSGANAEPIADFASYVAVVAYHGCHRYVRALYPQRARLKNRLRYLLARHATYDVWPGGSGRQLCGHRTWRGRDEDPDAARRLRTIHDGPDGFAREWETGDGLPRDEPGLAAAVLASLVGPADLDDLVGVLAVLLGIRDTPPQVDGHADRATHWEAQIPDPSPVVLTGLVDAERMRRLWQELLLLPVRQRAALLLNLRDAEGEGMIAWLPLTGVATMREIAAALEMPAVEFAALWRELPLEDRRIAELFTLTRQQVINLRKCARERLTRRLRGT